VQPEQQPQELGSPSTLPGENAGDLLAAQQASTRGDIMDIQQDLWYDLPELLPQVDKWAGVI